MLKLFRRNSKNELKVIPSLTNNNGLPTVGSPLSSFVDGVTEDKNSRCRRTMEDAHVAAHNICGTPDGGLFAVFDGHAGKHAADYCASVIVNEVECQIMENEEQEDGEPKSVPELLNLAFMAIDKSIELRSLSSGCTAAVALLRWENSQGRPVTVTNAGKEHKLPKDYKPLFSKVPQENCKRKLYTANVGDTRMILCRAGRALRLSYDHKGTDAHETQRVVNSGGMVISHRVNGMLAVTRALGDTCMKSLIIGNPYTTETEIVADDEFLILACDGLWDVCDDQKACDLIRGMQDPKQMSRVLVEFALDNFSTDNLTVMVVKLNEVDN